LLFTYDANGKPVWFAMTNLSQDFGPGIYSGAIYRIHGPPWLGVAYDTSKWFAVEAGFARFNLQGNDTMDFIFTLDGANMPSIPLSRIPF
jgi:hypothetical protein